MITDGTRFNQGEIVLVPFPYSDLTGSKQRPALIISNKTLNKTKDRLGCLITSNPQSDGIEITKEFFEEGSLPFKSWIKPYRIFTIDKRIIKRRIAKLNSKAHQKVVQAIWDYLSWDGGR